MAITFDMRGRNQPAVYERASGGALDRALAFRRARRHSLWVRFLKIALPMGAIGVAVLYALMLNTAWRLGPGRLNVGRIEVTADDLSMKNPSYFGVTKDGGRYEVRAKRAVMEFSKSQAPIKLIDIDGSLTQANNVTTKLKAAHGLLDNAKSELELYDGIEIDATNGMTARLTRATVLMKEHRVISKQPVSASTPTGSVRSSAMTMRTDTHEASFQGSVAVRMVQTGGPTIGGLGRDDRQPIEVSADQLDINDTTKVARFSGNVAATQGESILRSPELVVSYEGKGAGAQFAAAASPAEQTSRLSRLTASSGAVITAGSDRRVSSNRVDFDAKADTALFKGSVVINQGRNVLNGRRLFVDRRVGRSRLEGREEDNQPPGRITATFYQGDGRIAPAKPKSSTGANALSGLQGEIFGSFKTDPNAPMDVEADSLDVQDATRQATFHTNVRAQQGDFVVRTAELTAFYSGQAGFGLGSSAAADKAPAQLMRIEAKQKVVITSKDGQTATGDWATFDVKANTVLMGGKVVVTRGKDVAQGPRLKIDLTTGMYRFEEENNGVPAAAVIANPPPQAEPGKPAAPIDVAKRACPPGKQCLLYYPKDAQERAKELGKKVLPGLSGKVGDGWQPSTSASEPVRRSD